MVHNRVTFTSVRSQACELMVVLKVSRTKPISGKPVGVRTLITAFFSFRKADCPDEGSTEVPRFTPRSVMGPAASRCMGLSACAASAVVLRNSHSMQ